MSLFVDINIRGFEDVTPIYLAARGNHIDSVRTLLSLRAQTNLKDAAGNTPLHIAAKLGFVDICKVSQNVNENRHFM